MDLSTHTCMEIQTILFCRRLSNLHIHCDVEHCIINQLWEVILCVSFTGYILCCQLWGIPLPLLNPPLGKKPTVMHESFSIIPVWATSMTGLEAGDDPCLKCLLSNRYMTRWTFCTIIWFGHYFIYYNDCIDICYIDVAGIQCIPQWWMKWQSCEVVRGKRDVQKVKSNWWKTGGCCTSAPLESCKWSGVHFANMSWMNLFLRELMNGDPFSVRLSSHFTQWLCIWANMWPAQSWWWNGFTFLSIPWCTSLQPAITLATAHIIIVAWSVPPE